MGIIQRISSMTSELVKNVLSRLRARFGSEKTPLFADDICNSGEVNPRGDNKQGNSSIFAVNSLYTVEEIDEESFPETPPEIDYFSTAFMKYFSFLPIENNGSEVVVAMADPSDLNTRELIQRTCGKPIRVYKADKQTILQFIYRWYEAEADISSDGDVQEIDTSLEERLWDSPEHLKDIASEAPVIRLVNHLISSAIKLGASDIHIEPRKQFLQVRYRIDGILHDKETIPNRLKPAITSRVKLMAKMDIAEMRLPQDGRIKFKQGKKEIDIRVSSIPVHLGESLVLRILHQEDVYLRLDNLGFPNSILENFKSLINQPYGMLLVSGPTGSGKTTTLYAALNTINTPEKKIVTAEDPVEYQLEGINQVQVQPKIGLNFANCLRSFLRHDPDVILVGEIRDLETADIAIQAALTGHMVFSTIHTNDAAGAITRLEDMGIERFMIVSAVIGVLAQRLVRKVCPHCKEHFHLSDDRKAWIAKELGIEPDEIEPEYVKGKGCEECAGTGYRGRMGLFELLILSDSIQRVILQGADRAQIRKVAISEGMISLKADGLTKVKEGLTTYEEVLRVCR